MALDIIFEDDRLIAVNKPAGQVVIPGRNLPKDAVPLVSAVDEHLSAKAFVVHRIDRETSGVVLFAKDAQTHRALSMLFEARAVNKIYLAVVHGTLTGEGLVDKPLREFGSGRTAVAEDGKPAATRYRAVGAVGPATLVEVNPQSGRRHQIRVHLFSLGHPIVGDPLYGTPAQRAIGGRMMLHAHRLSLPWGGGEISVEARLGADWQQRLAEFLQMPPAINPPATC